ncbi:MAG TPA: GMC oxidoreductase [Candidatus Aquilonibacter sp.]|nr:GMC oxidoreductase [Candidatus Aquilonibacter sp.]
MHCVIGSGPAGVACAQALLARGADVHMLDAGIELEPGRAEIVRRFAAAQPAAWDPAQAAELKSGLDADTTGIPLKLVFGSDFPYRETEEKIPWRGNGIAFRPSLALGGLSNVWGAAMLPHRDDDVADWPVKNADMEKHYRAAAQITGLAAQHDDLEEIFPLHCENPGALKSSRQAELLLANLNRHRDRLRERGWRFGRARVAVRAADNSDGIGCIYCGFCLHGCPYGCIYNSADTVRELRAQKNFQYQRDVIVTKLRENAGKVFIEGFQRETRAPLSFEADRVYLAAGVIPTAQIILRSQSAYDRPLTLRDSQYFLFPLVLARRARGTEAEALYTLSQLFLELSNPQISRRSVHLQIYTYSDTIAHAVRKSLGPLKMFSRALVERMLVVQGYLHSDESALIAMRLKRDGEKDFLQLDARPNPATRAVVKKVVRELLSQARRLGGVVVPPMLQIAKPGRGYHCGGSLPMRENPAEFESDCLGRPRGWSRVHVVDASVFPSVPATTITLSVMANAHRIGWETALKND